MRYLDEQGRLFGTVSLIDVAAAVMVAALVPALIAAYRILSPPGRFAPPTPALLGVDLLIHPVPPSPGGAVPVAGQTLVTLTGERVGYVESVEPMNLATVWIQGDIQGGAPVYGGVQLQPGASVKVGTPTGEISGEVKKVYLKPHQWVTTVAQCAPRTVNPDGAIREGDAELAAHGKAIARLTRILKPATSRGRAADQDLVLEMRLYAFEQDGQFYFEHWETLTPLALGSTFPFQTSGYALACRIIDVEAS